MWCAIIYQMKNWTYKLNFQLYSWQAFAYLLHLILLTTSGRWLPSWRGRWQPIVPYPVEDTSVLFTWCCICIIPFAKGWYSHFFFRLDWQARVITLKAFLAHIRWNIILLKNRKIVRYYYLIATLLHPAPSRCMLAMPLWGWPPLWSLHSSQPVLWLWLVVWLHWWSRPNSCSVGAPWCPSITLLFSLRICLSSWCRLTVSRPVRVSLVVSSRSRSMWWVPWTLVLRIGFVGRWMQRRLLRMFRVPPWIIWLCRNSCFLVLPCILKLLCVRGVSCGFPIPKCRNFRVLYRTDEQINR